MTNLMNLLTFIFSVLEAVRGNDPNTMCPVNVVLERFVAFKMFLKDET
jgi:hypothetical protein